MVLGSAARSWLLPEGSVLPWQLDRLALAGVPVLGVTGVAVMLLDRDGGLRPVLASDPPGEALEQAQVHLGGGPAHDSLREQAVVAVDDLGADGRYAGLAQWLRGAGFRTVTSILSAPVLVAGEVAGGFVAYRDRSGPWTATDRRAVRAFAGLVGLLLQASTQDRPALEQREPAAPVGGAP